MIEGYKAYTKIFYLHFSSFLNFILHFSCWQAKKAKHDCLEFAIIQFHLAIQTITLFLLEHKNTWSINSFPQITGSTLEYLLEK